MPGPLQGIRVIELAGIGPGPFAAMVLADLGADVIRVDRASSVRRAAPDTVPTDTVPTDTVPTDTMGRGRRSIGVDLKTTAGIEVVLRLVSSAEALIEGFRPGVTERLGLGPEDCWTRNPKLVYGRMTGWGQDGPYASCAGHDINYAALSGTLSLIGRRGEPPLPPVNFLADFGGGGMLLALGILAGVLAVSRSGRGQVVDAAMVDGAALLSTMIWGFAATGDWGERGTNLLDTGAWFYQTYECADGRYITIGSLEPQFYSEMLRLTGLGAGADGGGLVPDQHDRSTWPAMKERMAAAVRTKSRDEWCALLEHTDACFAPVLTMEEATQHPHNRARGTFVNVAGVVQPGPAPRFSRTPPDIPHPPPAPGAHTEAVLGDLGFSVGDVKAMLEAGAVR
ncbi:MAG TPA: CaiB/BaiF CoA-transferase family protein [Acidimicrobiales bacterium]|nr:CaiB/BaiF CoA-transferase family protein [Acidimicrobiales bacterium]